MPDGNSGGDGNLSSFPLWLRATGFGLAFFLCAAAGNVICPAGGIYVSFWLPAGLYLAVLLLCNRRDWLWFIVAGLPANVVFDVLKGTAWYLAVIFYVANTLQAVLGAWLVQTFVSKRVTFSTVKEFFGFFAFAGLFPTLLGAIIGAGVLHFSGLANDVLQAGKVWWGSCAMAVLLFAPLVLVWFQRDTIMPAVVGKRGKQGWLTFERILEGVLLFGGMVVATWGIFLTESGASTPYKFRTLPFLVWAGMRFGRRGGATANFIYAVLVVYSASHETGLFPGGARNAEIAFMVQTFLVVAALVGLLPAIMLAERDATLVKLQESEAHYRNLTEAAFEGVCLSENERVVDVSKQFLNMLGYQREEVLGRPLYDLVAPESRDAVMKSVRGESEAAYAVTFLRKDGSVLQCESRAKIVEVAGRKLRMAALRDITERLQAEAALKRSEAKFRTLFDSANDVIFAMSDMRFAECNPRAEELFGCSREQILGRTPLDFSPEKQPDGMLSATKAMQIFNAAFAGHVKPFEWLYRRPDGTFVHAEVALNRVELDGRIFLQAIVRDITPRKKAEARLAMLTERLRLANAAAAIAVWEWDLRTNKLVCDRRWFEIFGVPYNESGEFSYTRWAQMVHPADWPGLEAELRETIARKGQSQQEFRIYREDGKLCYLHAAETVILDESGEPIRVVGVNLDITERKKAEAALRESEARYRAVVEFSPECIAVSVEDRLVFVNQAGARMMGVTTPEQLYGRLVYEFSPQAAHESIRERRRRVVTTGEPADPIEVTLYRADGSPIQVESHIVPFSYDGRPAIMSLVRDITARKKAEEGLREYQRMLATLLANLPGLVYRCKNDAQWTMEFVSDGCYPLTGYRPTELLHNSGTHFGELIHPDDRKYVTEAVQAAVRRRSIFELSYRIRTAIGETRIVWERGQGVYAEDGTLLALEGFITDVTAQRRAETEREEAMKREQEARAGFTRQLIESQEAERTRIAREIHDHLGQLLTALMLDLRAMERRASVLSDTELRKALVEKLNSAKDLANETITSVQKIASELRPGILDRLGLAAAIEVEAQAFQSRTGVTCRCVVPEDVMKLPTDRATAVFRIFQEILTNVARHAYASEVQIELSWDGSVVELVVIDNGVGLPEEHMTKSQSLGLLGMRERAEILGGQISFTRPPEGKGTMVTVRIPGSEITAQPT